MVPISAVLIAKNEEANIGRCLDSLGAMDQVVVYDTGSTDKTRELATEKNALVIDAGPMQPFHFANARNEAIKHARNEWVLTIDADETLDRKGVPLIALLFSSSSKQFSAVYGTHMNYAPSEEGRETFMPTRRPMLFKKDLWVWRYRIHERLFPVDQALRTHDMPELVIHHRRQGEQPSRAHRIDLLKLAIKEFPDYSFLRLQLGMEYINREQWSQALRPLEIYVDSERFEGVLGKAVAYMLLGRAAARTGDLQASMDAFMVACSAAPTRREPCYWAALELIRAVMPWEAIGWLERALRIAPKELPGFALYSEAVQGKLVETTLAECRRVCDEAKQKFEEQRKGGT